MLEARLRGGLCEGNSVRRGVGMSAVQVRALGQATAWCEALTQGEREAGLKARGEA